MNIESPFKGIPPELQWGTLGIICMVGGVYSITNLWVVGDLFTIPWIILGSILFIMGFFFSFFGILTWVIKTKRNLDKL